MMRLKKLGAALVFVAALGAVLASSAFAAAATTDVKWYTGASPGTELSGSALLLSRQFGPFTFQTTSGGFAIKLQVGEVECVECKIENSGGTAVGFGKLRFINVSVAEPFSCRLATGNITTKALKVKADYMFGTADYILFEPSAGASTGFATIELIDQVNEETCPIKTAIIPKGTVFVKTQNTTGTQAVEQWANSSAAINSEAGGSLHVGEEPASLTGELIFELAGGASFGTH